MSLVLYHEPLEANGSFLLAQLQPHWGLVVSCLLLAPPHAPKIQVAFSFCYYTQPTPKHCSSAGHLSGFSHFYFHWELDTFLLVVLPLAPFHSTKGTCQTVSMPPFPTQCLVLLSAASLRLCFASVAVEPLAPSTQPHCARKHCRPGLDDGQTQTSTTIMKCQSQS